jgi:polar amino acid transport system permease protein
MTTVPVARRRAHIPFRLSLGLWWVAWLLLLMLLFSGLSLVLGPVRLRTLSLDRQFISTWWLYISRGVIITLELSVASIICATVLAFLSALARLSRVASLNSLAGLYISLMRGTPLFLQFLFIYQALPQVGLVLSSFASAVMALSLNYGAYMSEIFRAGIQAVSHGQTEAAHALAMTPWQTLRRIVLPQAFRIVIPDIGNQFIAMQKDTALASAIALEELMGRARQAGLPRQHFFEALVIAAAWYWLLTIVLTYFQSRLEHRLAQSDRHR